MCFVGPAEQCATCRGVKLATHIMVGVDYAGIKGKLIAKDCFPTIEVAKKINYKQMYEY